MLENSPSRTAIRLRWTLTQRRPTRRSKRTVTRADGGLIVPFSRTARRRRGREDEIDSRRLGTTRTLIGADSMRGRGPSPAKTARTLALWGNVTLDAQRPSTPQTAPAIRVQAAPAAWSSTSIGAPPAGEPSPKCSSPDIAEALTPRRVLDVASVSAATGVAYAEARIRRSASWS